MAKTFTSITFDLDAPRRRKAGDVFPWSSISDSGTIVLQGGKELIFDVCRLFDKRLLRDDRVEWSVDLSQRWGRGCRAVSLDRFPEVRAELIAALKGRIEQDNINREAAYWGPSDDTVAADVAAQAEPEAPEGADEPKVDREYITETHGTHWLCQKTFNGTGGRSYWTHYISGPRSIAKPGVLGFYTSTLAEAEAALGRPTDDERRKAALVKLHGHNLVQEQPKAVDPLVATLKELQEMLQDWPTLRALSAHGAQVATEKKLKARDLIAAALATVEAK